LLCPILLRREKLFPELELDEYFGSIQKILDIMQLKLDEL